MRHHFCSIYSLLNVMCERVEATSVTFVCVRIKLTWEHPVYDLFWTVFLCDRSPLIFWSLPSLLHALLKTEQGSLVRSSFYVIICHVSRPYWPSFTNACFLYVSFPPHSYLVSPNLIFQSEHGNIKQDKSFLQRQTCATQIHWGSNSANVSSCGCRLNSSVIVARESLCK